MNSIATQNRTEYHAPRGVVTSAHLRSFFAFAVMSVIWISFQPFNGSNIGKATGSSIINQIGYTGLCALSLAVLFTAVDRRVVVALISPAWLLVFCALGFSIVLSPGPSDALRAVLFSIIATVLAANFITLPKGPDELSSILKLSCATVLGLCYIGLVAFPTDAIHQAGEVEAQHLGLWRGIFSHKNIAGPVMACIAYIGIYIARRGDLIFGLLITFGALLFIANTGSKTSLAVTPAVAMLVLVPSLMGIRGLAAIGILTAIVFTHAFTIGTVFSPSLDAMLRMVDSTTTFTGRVEIWEFAKPYLYDRPWTGFGYDGFWLSELVANGEQPFDRVWDPRGIVHGHNGYLDFALLAGIPMMCVLVWITVFAPVIDYLQTPRKKENVLLADLMFMIVAFTVMNAALESFFFRRADPVWLTLVIALFGLRLAARLPISNR